MSDGSLGALCPEHGNSSPSDHSWSFSEGSQVTCLDCGQPGRIYTRENPITGEDLSFIVWRPYKMISRSKILRERQGFGVRLPESVIDPREII